jgi:hypothetical protein
MTRGGGDDAGMETISRSQQPRTQQTSAGVASLHIFANNRMMSVAPKFCCLSSGRFVIVKRT